MQIFKTTIKVVILVSLTVLSGNLSGQGDVTRFLQMGQDNASTFAKLYLSPLGSSLGNNLNSGWFNTAQAHRLGRFDIRLGIPVTFVGSEQRYFAFNEADFENVALVNPLEASVPTVFAEDRPGPAVSYFGTQVVLPPGTGVSIFPVIPPILQLNIGLIRDTELMVRYVPEIEIEGFSTQLFGVGIKHGIKQYIPGLKLLPFDLSFIAAWSRFGAGYGLDYNPQADPAIDTDLQKIDISSTALNFNLVASKKLAVITFHGGVRYMISDTEFGLMGDYPVATPVAGTNVIIRDPVNVSMNHRQIGLNGGFRLKIGFISFFAEGTLANYSSVSGGISLGFHN